jgi:hypothetical protein
LSPGFLKVRNKLRDRRYRDREPWPIKSREDRQNPGRRLIRSWDERRRKGRKIVNPKYIEVIEEGRYLWATENGRHKLCGI